MNKNVGKYDTRNGLCLQQLVFSGYAKHNCNLMDHVKAHSINLSFETNSFNAHFCPSEFIIYGLN